MWSCGLLFLLGRLDAGRQVHGLFKSKSFIYLIEREKERKDRDREREEEANIQLF